MEKGATYRIVARGERDSRLAHLVNGMRMAQTDEALLHVFIDLITVERTGKPA